MIYKFFGLFFLLTVPTGVFADDWRRDIDNNTPNTIQDSTQDRRSNIPDSRNESDLQQDYRTNNLEDKYNNSVILPKGEYNAQLSFKRYKMLGSDPEKQWEYKGNLNVTSDNRITGSLESTDNNKSNEYSTIDMANSRTENNKIIIPLKNTSDELEFTKSECPSGSSYTLCFKEEKASIITEPRLHHYSGELNLSSK